MKPQIKALFLVLILAMELAFIWWAQTSYTTHFIDTLR